MDSAGVVLSKGLVNRREHLDSLLNAGDAGYSNLGEFMRSKEANNGSNGNGRNGSGDIHQPLAEQSSEKG
jgi:hypothetical protein